MNWKRYRILIVTGGVSLLASGLLGFWMMKSNGRNSELEQELQNLDSEISRLTSQKIYPSRQGFEALKAAQANVATRRDEFATVISAGQLPVPPMMSARFGDYAKRMVEQLRTRAAASKKGGEQGVVLADPQFGLKSYLEGAVPEAGEIPDLMVRLELVNYLSQLLFDAGISELISIEANKATAVAAPTDPSMAFPGIGSPALPPTAAGRSAKPVDPRAIEQIQKERLFEAVSFTLRFRVYEDHLWEIINRLASDPNQIVLRSIETANGNVTLWPAYLKPGRTADTRAAAAAVTAPRRGNNRLDELLGMVEGLGAGETATETPALLPGLSARRQLTTGGELISVVLELTLYRLKAPTPPAT
jgi:hypothetical protein